MQFRLMKSVPVLIAALAMGCGLSACQTTSTMKPSDYEPKRLVVEKTTVNGQVTYVVVRPGCPDWSDDPDWTLQNKNTSNFGCATASNLGLMLANPADYVKGRPNGPVDGEYSALGVRKYQEDRTEPLIEELTSRVGDDDN